MPLVFAGVCSHAPGITGRADRADPAVRDEFYAALDDMRAALEAARPDALVVIAAEHFANFFMDNMPSFAIGMADSYRGPIEDPDWLGIDKVHGPWRQRTVGTADRTRDATQRRRLRAGVALRPRDHGAAAFPDTALRPADHPGQHQLSGPAAGATPSRLDLRRVAARGRRRPPRTDRHRRNRRDLALAGDARLGKINEAWDREFLARWERNDREELLDYTDLEVYAEAGQGGFEIRTFVAVSAAAGGRRGTVHFYAPIPIFAVGCTVATYDL